MADWEGANAPFMTVKEMMVEIRKELRDLQHQTNNIEQKMVTKEEFEKFQDEALVSKRWKIGTGLTLLALVLTVAGILVVM